MTIGPDHRPWAGAHLTLYRNGGDDYEKLPESDRLPDPNRAFGGSVGRINPIMGISAETGGEGEFELFSGPGSCHISAPAGIEAPRFVLNNEPDWEVNLHAERPTHEEIVGRVVLQADPEKGVPEAIVGGFALNSRDSPGGIHIISDAQGIFRVRRRPVEMLFYVRSQDATVANILRVGPDDRLVMIRAGSAARARGRLIDANTGEPLAHMEVTYGVAWKGSRSGKECGGSVKTDEKGEFNALGLVPGWKYQFVALRNKVSPYRRSGGYWARLTAITPDDAEQIELGDFKLDPEGPSKPGATTGPVAPGPADRAMLYDTAADGNEQIAAALKTAQAEKKRVLLQFGANWCGWCHRLSACFAENADVADVLRENYIVVLIDVDLVDGKKHNADVVERYGNPTQHGLPVLVVLDAQGELLKTKDTDELEEDDRHSQKKVLAFLNRWKPK